MCANRGFPVERLLLKVLNRRMPVSAAEFNAAFDRVIVSRWRGPIKEGRRVLLLGAKARMIVGLSPVLASPVVLGGVVYRQLPLPHRHSRWWRDETCAAVAGLVLEELYMGWVTGQGE